MEQGYAQITLKFAEIIKGKDYLKKAEWISPECFSIELLSPIFFLLHPPYTFFVVCIWLLFQICLFCTSWISENIVQQITKLALTVEIIAKKEQ